MEKKLDFIFQNVEKQPVFSGVGSTCVSETTFRFNGHTLSSLGTSWSSSTGKHCSAVFI